MVRSNELFGVLIAALLLLIGPTRPAAAAAVDVPLDQIDQEFGKPNPNAPAALQAQQDHLAARRVRACAVGSSKQKGGRWAAFFLMSFLRHKEIYHFDEGAIPQDRAPAHRNDEFPAGYSSAGCNPAEPASASPTEASLQENRSQYNRIPANGRECLNCLSQPGGQPHPLSRWLNRRISKRVPATFTKIEEIVGFMLPPSARTYQPWWANDRKHVHAKAWLNAGFRTEDVNLPNETLVFVRF